MIILTAEQFRMAKAALRLKNPDVAEITGLHKNTLNGLDQDNASDRTRALVKLKLEEAGIEFIPANGGGAGVRLKKE